MEVEWFPEKSHTRSCIFPAAHTLSLWEDKSWNLYASVLHVNISFCKEWWNSRFVSFPFLHHPLEARGPPIKLPSCFIYHSNLGKLFRKEQLCLNQYSDGLLTRFTADFCLCINRKVFSLTYKFGVWWST